MTVGVEMRLSSSSNRSSRVRALARLLDRGADANARDVDGATALHAACEEGHAAAARLLLARGADVGARNNLGDTALHAAAHRGKLAIDGQHDFEGASLSSLEPDARFAEPFSPVRGEENGYGEGDLRQRRAVRNLRTPTGSVLI